VIEAQLVSPAINPDRAWNGLLGESGQVRGWVFLLLIGLSLGGCVAVHWEDAHGVVQHGGAIRYSMINSPHAHVLLVQSIGLDVRVGSHDPGLSIGYRKVITVQPHRSEESTGNEDGMFCVTDAAPSESGLFVKRVIGAELGFSLISNGLMIGYEHTAVVVGPSVSESVTTKIDFAENDLHATRYSSEPGGYK
jgi:hypothetical protein